MGAVLGYVQQYLCHDKDASGNLLKSQLKFCARQPVERQNMVK